MSFLTDVAVDDRAALLKCVSEKNLHGAAELCRGNPAYCYPIAALTGDEATTIEDFYEPYLLQLGLLARTPKGRVVTEKGRRHLQNPENKV